MITVQLFFIGAGVVFDESALSQFPLRATPTPPARLEPAAQKDSNPAGSCSNLLSRGGASNKSCLYSSKSI